MLKDKVKLQKELAKFLRGHRVSANSTQKLLEFAADDINAQGAKLVPGWQDIAWDEVPSLLRRARGEPEPDEDRSCIRGKKPPYKKPDPRRFPGRVGA